MHDNQRCGKDDGNWNVNQTFEKVNHERQTVLNVLALRDAHYGILVLVHDSFVLLGV